MDDERNLSVQSGITYRRNIMGSDKSNNKNDTGNGYSSMLTAIEELVSKEGKTIREAVLLAEDKLSEWSELGREEVNVISDEVTRDLGSLRETIEEAKSSFKEKWEIDKKYLTESTWGILSSVADKTTVALTEFTNEIKQRAQDAQQDLHKREHKDHREWHSDHEMWLDDIERWQKYYQQALLRTQSIQEKIQLQGDKLAKHAKIIRTHEYIDTVHEKEIARSEENPENKILDEISSNNEKSYEEMIAKHQQEAEIHAQLKEEYRNIMLLIAKLNKLS